MSLYNNCSHQNWRLLIELLEYLIMKEPIRWLELWSIGWVYTKASSLYNHKINANGPGVKRLRGFIK